MVRTFSSMLLVLVVAAGSAPRAHAQLIVTIGDVGPSTVWTFSGSSNVLAFNFVPAANSLQIQVSTAIFDNPTFADSVGYAPSGVVTYSLNGNPVGTIDLIRISSATLWDFSLDTSVLYNSGDTVSWSGSATFNFPNARLIHDVIGTPTIESTIGSVATSSLAAVPEPSPVPLAGVTAGAVAAWQFATRRRRGRAG